ncbi:MAG: hypothetical protein CVU46_02300 [Chloroflexi bacterium HGW-Chloroflexi-8]|nr:MAG: hypothetical protein CVU46_02300 [Chloroflexi bacterium HGW-Chloroflexi-8]
MMMDDYIDVKINVFEHTGQHAQIRKSLTVTNLIEEILKEFDDIGVNASEKYTLLLKGVDRPLNPALTMEQLDIQPQDEFTLGYAQQTIRQMLDPEHYATLREETTGKVFDIQWHPAVIGRPSTEVNHNIMLAVNMQLIPTGMTISRRHAQINYSNGKYYIEALSENNPTFINGKEVPFNNEREIRNGDRIMLGQHKVSMVFEARAIPGSSGRASSQQQRPPSQPVQRQAPASVSQPISQPVSQPATPVSQGDGSATRVGVGDLRTAKLIIERCTNIPIIGQIIELTSFPFILGRSTPILSSESDVSRQHAQIDLNPTNGQYTIVDIHSTNGVTLNGVKIDPDTPYEIVPGTKIGMGHFVLMRFEI